MDALRQCASPSAQRLYHYLQLPWTADNCPAFRLPFLTADAGHEFLNTPGAAAALATVAATEVLALSAAGGATTEAGGWTAPPFRVDFVATEALFAAVASCRCADAAIMPPLLAALPKLAARHGDPFLLSDAPPALKYRCVLTPVVERLLQSEAVALGFCDDPPPEETHPSCATPPAYATVAGAAAALADDAVVLRFFVRRVGRSADQASLGLESSPPDGVADIRILLTLCRLVPRRLLDATPDVFDVLTRAVGGWASRGVPDGTVAMVSLCGLLFTLQVLGAVDPPRLRRTPGLLAALVAAHDAYGTYSVGGVVPVWLTQTIMALAILAAPAADAFTASDAALRWLVRIADGPDEVTATDAACLALYVGRRHVEAGAAALPPPLASAGATWARHLPPHGSHGAAGRNAAAVAAALVHLSSGRRGGAGRGRSTLGGCLRPPPWAPFFFPQQLLEALPVAPRRCWGCGAHEQAGARAAGRLLPRCSGCSIAVYCSRSCIRASWKGLAGGTPHKTECAGWALYARQYLSMDPRQPRRVKFNRRMERLAGEPASWEWLSTKVAKLLVEAGLPLAAVVVLVDVPLGEARLLPAAEYAMSPDAVSMPGPGPRAQARDQPVLHVVHREHPPRVEAVPVNPQMVPTVLY